MRTWLIALPVAALAACATVPGADYPRIASSALAHPEETAIGRKVEPRAVAHRGQSAFRLFASGSDAFTLRMQMANAAQRTLDVQYFIIKDDDTGRLLQDAMLRAANRGVRVRVLIDDTEARGKNDRTAWLAAHPNIEVRIYNPFAYRGSISALRFGEFALKGARLDYRMHNKLFVVDNEIAVVGGRNLGDEYFDTGDDPQFGDYDVFALGPIARRLSASFDAYWNSELSIPVGALQDGVLAPSKLKTLEDDFAAHREKMRDSAMMRAVATGNPLAAMLAGDSGLTWAGAEVVADSPDKGSVENGDGPGALLRERLFDAAAQARRELLIVTPYFVPGAQAMKLLHTLRQRGVTVRVLTNSLESTDMPVVHAAYQRDRIPLLQEGVELYEVKPVPGKPQPRGGALKAPSSGLFALHAKVYVFDRSRIFIGSANFDQRSMHINTEIGLLIDSQVLAQQVIARFNTIAQPANSFVLALRSVDGIPPRIVWQSVKDGQPVTYDAEPGNDRLRKLQVDMYSLLPLDNEL
jgi:putative cardiolipin synthase